MALLEIRVFPDPVLKTRTEPVTDFGPSLKKLVQDMFDTMYDAPGVGLAANQVGVSLRLAVIDVDFEIEGEDEEDESPEALANRVYKNKNPRVFINPEIIQKSGKHLFKEGCLSVPGFAESVERLEKVRVRYQDLEGKHHELEAEGLLAVCLQHEVDHLDGRLYIDRLSPIKRSVIANKVRKGK